ncbi:MAG: autotransporter-associated beta strand repeat-containing protein [Luteolibacter sp.]
MKAPFFSPFLNLHKSNRCCRASALGACMPLKITPALLGITVGLLFVPAAQATTYTYTAPNSTTTNTWSSGTAWSAVPVGAADTTLGFSGSFAGNLTATSQDNIVGAFQLNVMTLNASNSSVFTTSAYNITPNPAANTLNFVDNGGTAPTVNLNSSKGIFSNNVNYTVSVNATIDGGLLTFQGNGSNGFNYSGILSDGSTAASVTKTGSSALTLSSANTFTGGLTLNQGTLNINHASALGTGTFTMANGVKIDNTSAADINTSTNNNAQVWNGNFTWGGTKALNLGTGPVTLAANSIISVGGTGALKVDGAISDGGSNYSLTIGNPGVRSAGTLILSNTTNSYGGGTFINSGFLQIASATGIGGSGANVTVNNGGGLATGYALDQSMLGRLTANSTGTIALAADSANNLDFSAAGANLVASLGAIGNRTYSGILTPQGTTYRLGGAGGNLIMATALTGANSLKVGDGGSAGTVTLNAAGTYSGGTTVTGIQGSTGSVLQTNILEGVSNTPFGSNPAITLNNGTLGFGTAATLASGNVMNVTGYNVTADTGTIKLQVGSGSSVTFNANTLNQSSLGGVLYLAPSTATSLGTTEKVLVTGPSVTIPLTVTNGMIAPSIIDSTNRKFLTYDAVNGFVAATTTTTFGVNNVVSIATGPNSAQSAYALRTGALMQASDNFTIGAGGFLSTVSQNNATGTINFGSTPGYYGIYGGGAILTSMNATAGVTFYGTGAGFSMVNLNIKGGLTFASGSWTFTPQPTGSEVFQTTNPNPLVLLSGATITEQQGSKMTFASIDGTGTITESAGNAFTLTINGLTSTGTSTFSGPIIGASGGAGNIIKTGSNTQVFAGASSYNGATTVNGGTLRAGVASVANVSGAFGLNSAVTVGNLAGATLDLASYNTHIGSLAGGGVIGATVTLGAATLTTGGNNSSTSFGGVISGSGGLAKIGTGTQTFTGANTYSGATTVSAGALTVSSSAILSDATSPLAVNNPNTGVGTTVSLNLNSGQTVGSLSGTIATPSSLTNLAKINLTGAATVLTVNQTVTNVFAGQLTGSGGLTLGSGSNHALTLSGANTYTGATTVSAGKLTVNGSLADTATTVANGASLGGDGSIVGATTYDTGSKLPWTVSNWSAGPTLDAGTVTMNGTVTVVVDESSLTNFTNATKTFTILSATNLTVGTVVVDSSGFTSGSGTWSAQKNGNNLELVYTAGAASSAYDSWALTNITSISPGANATPTGDPDGDGRNNLSEFAFNGNPLSGSDSGKIYSFVADSSDGGTDKELILTAAVRKTAPVFAGSPSPLSTVDGITYTIQGSQNLATFTSSVSIVTPVITGLPTPGTDYEYRSFSLDGSNGLSGLGFLRAKVTQP